MRTNLRNRKIRIRDLWFLATVCKTVRPMLSDRCLSCPVLSCLVCNVRCIVAKRLDGLGCHLGTWYGGGPRPRPHCVRWGPSSSPKKGHSSPQFSAHIYCGQTAGCIRMPFGMEVGLDPSDIVKRSSCHLRSGLGWAQ